MKLEQCFATFLPTAHPTLTMAREGNTKSHIVEKGDHKNEDSIRKSLSYIYKLIN
jgi:hypothetical protein